MGGARWRGEEGEDGDGGSVRSGAREGSGLTFKPGISEEMREVKKNGERNPKEEGGWAVT